MYTRFTAPAAYPQIKKSSSTRWGPKNRKNRLCTECSLPLRYNPYEYLGSAFCCPIISPTSRTQERSSPMWTPRSAYSPSDKKRGSERDNQKWQVLRCLDFPSSSGEVYKYPISLDSLPHPRSQPWNQHTRLRTPTSTSSRPHDATHHPPDPSRLGHDGFRMDPGRQRQMDSQQCSVRAPRCVRPLVSRNHYSDFASVT